MRIRCSGVGILLFLLLPVAQATAANTTVTATPSLTFSPPDVGVNPGEMVTWNNGGGFHNVHFDDNSYQQPPSVQSNAWSVSRTFNTPGMYRYYCDLHGGPNGVGMAGIVRVAAAYPRPNSARKIQAALAPAYKQCTTSNRQHGPPLASPSCNPPLQESDWVTVGSASSSFVTVKALPGDGTVPPDDADVQLIASLTDIRNKTGLTDYAGQLQVKLPLTLTDRVNGPAADEPGSSQQTFTFTVPCVTNTTAVGSTCSITTTADALQPGAVIENRRSIWDVAGVQVLDGGPDGNVSTASGNTVFARQAVFVP